MDINENETELIADMNFIVLEDKHVVYDLTTGMLYRIIEGDTPEIYARLRVSRVASGSPWVELFTNEVALDFWKQLISRIDLSY